MSFTPGNVVRRVMSVMRPLLILVACRVLFVLSLAVLLVFYGGHRDSYMFSRNPYCQSSSQSNAEPSSVSSALPPRLVLQLSDIHVTSDPAVDRGRSRRHMANFEARILPTWGSAAHAVVVSGDLVNAIERNPRPLGARSRQIPAEWSSLRDFARRVNAVAPWIVTHGNHDTFGGHVSTHAHISDFINPLTSPRANQSSAPRIVPHSIANNSIAIVALDLSQPAPIHRPFNFFGDAAPISPAALAPVRDSGKPTIVFAHYPSSTLRNGRNIHSSFVSTHQQQQKELRDHPPSKPNVVAYLSGHLHSMYGLAPKGLTAVSSVSGALEVESLDLSYSAAFRVLAFDHTDSLVSTTLLSVNQSANPLDDVMFVNLPEAGLCAPGAGSAAINAKYIRLFSPFLNLSNAGVRASINDVDQGPIVSLAHSCTNAVRSQIEPRMQSGQITEQEDDFIKRSFATCKSLYGFAWDSESFISGTHQISLHYKPPSSSSSSSQEELSKDYTFSVDGSVPLTFSSFLSRAISIIFALSQFDIISSALCYIAVLLISTFSLFTMFVIRTHYYPSLLVMCYAIAIALGLPFLFAPQLTASPQHQSWGWLSLYYLSLPSEPSLLPVAVDAPFLISRKVFWNVLVPTSLVPVVAHSPRLFQDSQPIFARYALLYPAYTAIRKSYSMTMEIAGAHGYTAALVSPGCFPLFVLVTCSTIFAILSSHMFRREQSNSKDKKNK